MKLLLRLCLALLLGFWLRPAMAQSDQPSLFLDPGGHTGIVRQALFTPGGKELISVGEDKVIRVWDTQTGKQLGTIHGQIGEGPHGQLYAAALSHDGKTLAVAGNTYEGELSSDAFDKNRVYVYVIHLDDLRAQPIRVSMSLLPTDGAVKAHMNTIFTLAFSPTDDSLLASGSQDNNGLPLEHPDGDEREGAGRTSGRCGRLGLVSGWGPACQRQPGWDGPRLESPLRQGGEGAEGGPPGPLRRLVA